MKARVSGSTIFLIPSRQGEKELLSKINSLTYEHDMEILADESGDTLTNLHSLKLHFHLADDGIEVVDAIVET